MFVLVSLLHTAGSVSWGTVEASSRKLTPHLSYLFGGELTLCERKVDIACCCEARIQNRVDKRTFVISPTSTTINSSIQPTLSFVDILYMSNSSRWNLCHAEAGCSLMHLCICWGNNGNGAVKLIHCNTSKEKNVKLVPTEIYVEKILSYTYDN